MSAENYEELKHCSVANITALSQSMPVLTADYGAGYEVGATVSPYGLKRWSLTANVVPDTENYTVTYEVDGDEFTKTRFRYYWEFYQRHLLLGNKPFIISEPETGKKFLVCFEDTTISFKRMHYRMYGGHGMAVREQRAPDVAFNPDGSIGGSMIGAEIFTEDGVPVTEDGFLLTL